MSTSSQRLKRGQPIASSSSLCNDVLLKPAISSPYKGKGKAREVEVPLSQAFGRTVVVDDSSDEDGLPGIEALIGTADKVTRKSGMPRTTPVLSGSRAFKKSLKRPVAPSIRRTVSTKSQTPRALVSSFETGAASPPTSSERGHRMGITTPTLSSIKPIPGTGNPFLTTPILSSSSQLRKQPRASSLHRLPSTSTSSSTPTSHPAAQAFQATREDQAKSRLRNARDDRKTMTRAELLAGPSQRREGRACQEVEETELVEIPSADKGVVSPLVPSLTTHSRPNPPIKPDSLASSSRSCPLTKQPTTSRRVRPRKVDTIIKSLKQSTTVDVTGNSLPPSTKSSQRLRQTKLESWTTQQHQQLKSKWLPTRGGGSIDDPCVISPTPSPVKSTTLVSGVTERDAYIAATQVVFPGRPSVAAEPSDWVNPPAPRPPSEPTSSAAVSRAVTEECEASPVASPPRMVKEELAHSPDLPPEATELPVAQVTPTKLHQVEQAVEPAMDEHVSARRSARQRPAVGFFTMSKPGTPIRLWPQHIKVEVPSPTKKRASPLQGKSKASPLAATRVHSRASKAQLVAEATETADDDKYPEGRGGTANGSPSLKEDSQRPNQGHVIRVETSRRCATGPLSPSPLTSSSSSLAVVSPNHSQSIGINKVGSPSHTHPAPELFNSTRPLSGEASNPHSEVTVNSDEDGLPTFIHLSKSARKRLRHVDIVPASVEGERPLWDSPTLGRCAAFGHVLKLEPEAKTFEEPEFLPLDPDEDFDFFDYDAGHGEAAVANSEAASTAELPVRTSAENSATISPVQKRHPPLVSDGMSADLVKAAATSPILSLEAEIRAARLEKMRQQIQDRARAEAQVEAEEAARIRAAMTTATKFDASDGESDSSEDDISALMNATVAPRRSTRQIKPTAPAFDLSPASKSDRVHSPPTKEELELEKLMCSITKKRRNGETAEELERVMAISEAVAARTQLHESDTEESPSKRPRLSDTGPAPFPYLTSGRATSSERSVSGDPRATVAKLSLTEIKKLLGDDADLVQELLGSGDTADGTVTSTSRGDIGSWAGFWNDEVPEQIGEQSRPAFKDNALLAMLSDSAAAKDSDRMVSLLNAGFAEIGAADVMDIRAVSTWLFELSTLSRDRATGEAAFGALGRLMSSSVRHPFGDPSGLLQVLQHAIASFGARSSAFVGEPTKNTLSYSMEFSRREAATVFWVRLVHLSITNHWLGSEEIRVVMLALVQLAMDRSTSPRLRMLLADCIGGALIRLTEDQQMIICADLFSFFAAHDPSVKAAAVLAVGRCTDQSRRLARWLAVYWLSPQIARETTSDDYISAPSADAIQRSLGPVSEVIKSTVPNERSAAAYTALLSETLTDIEGLVLEWRTNPGEDGVEKVKASGLEMLSRRIRKIQARITDNKGENIPMSVVKGKLYHLSISLDRQRMFFERKYQWNAPMGDHLQRAEGGQTRLSFGGRGM